MMQLQNKFILAALTIKEKLLIIIAIALSLLLLSCKSSPTTQQEIELPENSVWTYRVPEAVAGDWTVDNLANVGLNLNPINSLMTRLRSTNDHFIHSVLLIKNGKLVLEEYFSAYDKHHSSSLNNGITHFKKDTLHFMASVSKSVMSVCLGIAVDRGAVENMNNKIYTYFPQYSSYMNEAKKRISIINCCNMSSGFPWDESTYLYSDPRNDLNHMLYETDPIGFYFNRNMISEPGSRFLYSSGDANLLGEIVHKSMGISLLKVAEKYLFTPLGINNYFWWLFPYADSMTYASSGLYLRPRDLAKIGQLYLNGGLWNGQRIISEEWINNSITNSIAMPGDMQIPYHSYAYGYQWWLERFNNGSISAYSARGHGNQFLIVIPDYNILVVLTGGAYDASPLTTPITWHSLVEDYIIPAIN